MDEKFLKYIPLDKSWIIRMGILDLLHNKPDCKIFLENQNSLNDDLKSLLNVLKIWKSSAEVEVGESGTLYRFLQFISWKYKLNKKFIKKGTLKNRNISNDQEIVNLSIKELLKLDNQTSQWASASLLCGNNEIISNPPFKLKTTYEAISHWKEKRDKNQVWEPKYDETIKNQAISFMKILKNENMQFDPKQAEDYCFARAFNILSKEEGEKRWPSLKYHETDRLKEMERCLKLYYEDKEIDSLDHRVVQSLAMLQIANKKELKIKFKNAVNKSWPEFWDFLKSLDN